MAVKRGGLGKGLGKGLDALIPEDSTRKVESKPKKETEIQKVVKKEEIHVKLSEIEPNREQPRKHFDEDSLLELAESIKQYGIIQPLVVQKRKDYYEIIAGERRWRAAKMAGLKEIPVIVKNYTEQEIVEISLIENIQRENLNPIEEAQAYKRLLTEFQLKQDEVAERVSKSRTAVTNSMRLLKLDEKVQQMVIDDMISSGHARALLAVEDKEMQYTLAMKIFDEKLSVREVEKLVKSVQNKEEEKKKEEKDNSFIYKDIEERIKTILGTKVKVKNRKSNKGCIEIEYYSNQELERLLDLFESLQGR
jgi:ParB family chromosome partitioning protein